MQLVALNVKSEVRVHKSGCSDIVKLIKKGRLAESDLVPFEAEDKTAVIAGVWETELNDSQDPETDWHIYTTKTKFSACGVAQGPDKLPDGGGYEAYIEALKVIIEPEVISTGSWTLLTESETAAVNADPEAVAAIAVAQDAADELVRETQEIAAQDAADKLARESQKAETHRDVVAANAVVTGSDILTVTAWDVHDNQLLFPANSVLHGGKNHSAESRFTEVSFSTESQLKSFLARNHTTGWTKNGERAKIHMLHVVRASDPNNVVVVPGARHGASV